MATKVTHPREWAVFSSIDRSGDGKVSREELLSACQVMEMGDRASELQHVLDVDGDGEITFEEFCERFGVVSEARTISRLHQWDRCIGIGVAGNVAGHMAQAGEADPASPAHTATPAAIFVFYLPQPLAPEEAAAASHAAAVPTGPASSRLSRFPVTNAVIDFPHIEGGGKVQVEPEVALHADIIYKADGRTVEKLVPRQIAAFNDCSMRELAGSQKLSEKKNWGFGSKGISLHSFSVDSFSPGTLVDRLVLTSFVKRGAQIQQYSQTAPARTYLLFFEPLLEWIVDRMNNQGDEGKWESISEQVEKAGYPTHAWIALGAGEYTPWGEVNYLQPADEALVIIYDEQVMPSGPDPELVATLFEDKDTPAGMIALHQTFV